MLFAILTLLSALAVAGVSGWFSIVGVMSIYAGAPFHAALVMGVVLEGAKLVTTSWLYRNWHHSSWKLKIPLIYFTVALMIATSIGVFGFLTKAHLEQGSSTINNIAKVERLDQQIAREKATIADNEKVISQLDTAINSFLGNDKADRALTVRRAQAPQRKQLRDEIQAAQKQIDVYSEEKLKLTSEVRALQLEVGPIRYIAELFYGTGGDETAKIETAVRIFTLLIVSTLDPLAVILLIAANHSLLRRQNEKNKKSVEDSEIHKSPTKDEQKSACTIKEKEDNESQIEGNLVAKTEEIRLEPSDSFPATKSNQTSGANNQVDETVYVEETKEGSLSVSVEDDIAVKEFFEKGKEVARRLDNNDSLEGLADVTIRQVDDNDPIYISEIVEIKEDENDTDVNNEPTLLPTPELPSAPLPAIISPAVSRITIPEPEIISDVAEVGKPQLTQTQPWAHNEEVLAEILGNQPHFVPMRINEKTESKLVNETLSSVADKTKEETLKVEQDGKNQNKDNSESITISNTRTDGSKYPTTLSWLNEFKRN